MLIQFIKKLSEDQNLVQNDQAYWKQIFNKCFKLLFEEYYDITTTKKIFTIILNIIDHLYP